MALNLPISQLIDMGVKFENAFCLAFENRIKSFDSFDMELPYLSISLHHYPPGVNKLDTIK
jgi:hypothetical protein